MGPATPDPFAHRARRAWRRLSVDVPAGLSDAAADLVAEITGSGVEIIASGLPGGPATGDRIVGYLAEAEDAGETETLLHRQLTDLAARAGGGQPVEVRSEPLLEEDWGGGWKEHFRPFCATRRLVIKPTWEAYAPREGEAVLEMDPGMAFGTGLHASTRLALELVEECCAASSPARVLDIGTGTGILAMAAALRGAGDTVAIDNDPDALAAARLNVARNRLAERVRVADAALDAVDGSFELIVANITADVLVEIAPSVAAHLVPAGALVLSGILAGPQCEEVRETYRRLGLACGAVRERGEWAALLLFAPSAQESLEVVDEEGRVVGRAPGRPLARPAREAGSRSGG